MNPQSQISAADLFCGAGGTTTGLLRAAATLRRSVRLLAINHWNVAIDTHTRNHPGVQHLCESLDNLDPRKVIPSGKLDILCASPECTHFSNARGGKPCSDQSRSAAWQIIRWAEALRIDSLLIENVREFRHWGPLRKNGRPMKSKRGHTFAAFLNALESIGYKVEWRILNAADYGDPTTRQRLFIMAQRARAPRWPEPTHAGRWKPARDIIDWTIKSQSLAERKKPLSPNTIKRIIAGLKKFGGSAFILHTTHTTGDRASDIGQPLPTVTTARRGEMAVIEPFIVHLRGTQPNQINSSAHSIEEPLPALTTSGANVALCEPFLLKYNGDHKGRDESASRSLSLAAPLPTQHCANRFALVEPFIVKYYGAGEGSRPVTDPLATVTSRDRFALVEPELSPTHQLDVRFRMLQPRELASAMSFPLDYHFTGTRESQVKQIGNAVPVCTAAALCHALLS